MNSGLFGSPRGKDQDARRSSKTALLFEQGPLTAATAELSFSNIPDVYRDLRVIAVLRPVAGDPQVRLTFNGDSGANYEWVASYNVSTIGGANAASGSAYIGLDNVDAGSFHYLLDLTVFNYARPGVEKYALATASRIGESIHIITGRWSGTAPINAIRFVLSSGSFPTNSSISVYGTQA